MAGSIDGVQHENGPKTSLLGWLQCKAFLEAKQSGKTSIRLSLDTGRTFQHIELSEVGPILPEGVLEWQIVEKLFKDRVHVYAFDGESPEPVRAFDQETGAMLLLTSTDASPSLMIAGQPVRRMGRLDPFEEAKRRVKALGRIKGDSLDTHFGLGYHAHHLAIASRHVETVDFYEATSELCEQNPWSCGVLLSDKVHFQIGDILESIEDFSLGEFEAIVHDPPNFSINAEMYSEEFYAELRRVLRKGGRLAHSIGSLTTGNGPKLVKQTTTRLRNAGFVHFESLPEIGTLVARV